MSGTLRLHQLFVSSRNFFSTAIRRPSSAIQVVSVRRDPVLCHTGRRFLSEQAAPAVNTVSSEQSRDGASQSAQSRPRRNLQSSFGSVRNPDERGKRQNAPEGNDIERGLAKLDVDVKRAGRVGLMDLTAILKEMKELSKIPSQAALLLIRCCGSLLCELKPTDRIKIAEDLWNQLEKSCERLDISHYNALLKVHLENSHKFDPSVFLASMEQKGLQPNRVTFQRMAAYYCQQGDIDGATRILEFMRAKDLPINETVFNVLIQGYGRANDMANAEGVLDMMRSSQLEPSADTYRTLLEVYAEKGDIVKLRKGMEEATKNGVQLSDADYFSIIQAMASKGHTEHVTEIVEKLRKSPGFFHDALNACLRLVDHNQPDVAYRILSSLNLPRDINDRSGFGIIFTRKLLRYNEPLEKIWHYVDDMREKQLNPWAVDRCLESAFQIGRMDFAQEFLHKMVHTGQSVRSHYFWPIFAAYGKEGNVKGIFEAVGKMTELNVPISLDTLTDYVLPGLRGLSNEEIISQFKTRYPSVSVLNPLAVYNLDKGNISEAAKLIVDHEIVTNPTIVVRPLADAYLKSKDFAAVEAFLKVFHKQTVQQANLYDTAGQFLLQVLQTTKGDENELVELMGKMVRSGLKISNAVTNSIESRFRGRIPEKLAALLDKLTSPDGNFRLLEDEEFGKHPRNMNVDELESHLRELKSKNMNTRGVLRRLLQEHARLRNVERVEEIKAELDASGFEYSGAMYAQMMEMYTFLGDLEKALEIQKKAQNIDRSFVTDGYKMLNLAALMVSKDRTPDALLLLDEYVKRTGKPIEFESLERNIFRILNAAAERGDQEALLKLWDKLNSLGKFSPTNLICGPFVKIHIVKDDIPGAVKAFQEAVEKYKQTPWKGEVMRRLVETEDTASLQTVMDLSIKIHGETNSLYDLAFAFIEGGRTKQAQKIFDTPGLRARQDRLEKFSNRLIERNSVEQMEALLTATRDVFDVDRDALYEKLIRLYGKLGEPDKALAVWINMQEESLQASPQTLKALAAILKEHKREVPFAVPENLQSPHAEQPVSPEESRLLTSIQEDNPDLALEQKQALVTQGHQISLKGYSHLIELLLQKERVKEAVSLTREMLEQGNHPFPTVSKFLISKLSRAGDTSTLEELKGLFTEKLSQFLTMEKHIFMAYVNSNRSEEILSRYEKDLQLRMPVGGLLHLLRTSPNLLPRVEMLVERCADSGDVRPAVAFWTHLFSERKFEESQKLLERYPAVSARLRAIAICERAHENNDFELLRKLIETLRQHSRPNVAMAYSYLIGLNCHNRDYRSALAVLKEAQETGGLGLHELRLSVLRVLEKGLLQMGEPVPFRVPDIQRQQQEFQQNQDRSGEFDEDSAGRSTRRQ